MRRRDLQVGEEAHDECRDLVYRVMNPKNAYDAATVATVLAIPYSVEYGPEYDDGFLETLHEDKAYVTQVDREVLESCFDEKLNLPEFVPDLGNADELADAIKYSGKWNNEYCKALCKLAGMEKEWAEADGENFKEVVEEAADKLGTSIY